MTDYMPPRELAVRCGLNPRSTVWLALCLCATTSVITSCTQPTPERKSSNLSVQQAPPPASSEIQQAFADGIAELSKDGAPFGRKGYQITIEPDGSGWKMKYSHIPPKASGDRLLFIQGRRVEVIPLF